MKNYADPAEIMYHTGLSAGMIRGAKYALLPGDPGRVEGLAKALDRNALFIASHRDYTTWLARIENAPVLVMSTGMGGLRHLCRRRAVLASAWKHSSALGTTGSIQEDLHLGDVVINTASIRMDGASRAYAPIEFPAAADMDTVLALREAAKESGIPFKTGISISTDSFWPGQERYDSFGGYVLKRLQGSLEDFRHLGCTNYEMENATLFTLCSVLGLKAASICGVVAKRTDSESVAPHEIYEKAEKRFQKVVKRALEKMISHSRSGENIS